MTAIAKDLLTKTGRKVNVRPDTIDFRDKMFVPTLIEVPTIIDLHKYKEKEVPVLDQGKEGACTGFGLATVVNYLLRTRGCIPDYMDVSPFMLYQMAKRYDEWRGDDYEGSSARGSMKGWHKHGVCSQESWDLTNKVTPKVLEDAVKRPLGAYFRVNHKDLIAMHCAISEVGILYATALVHTGWEAVGNDGIIKLSDDMLGGHAFAIVAYDEEGLWIQNSWGNDWGFEGFARISYDDWLKNGTDVWVARLGAPVHIKTEESVAARHSAAITYTDAFSNFKLRRHIISLGNDGYLKKEGTYGTTEEDVMQIFEEYFREETKEWGKKRLLLYAHGGLVPESSAVQRIADYRSVLLQAEIYPISFIWHSDLWSTVTSVLKDAVGSRRPEGFLDAAKDFMLDRLDDTLEPIIRMLGGNHVWDEMKENAEGATNNKQGGVRIALKCIDRLLRDDPNVEIHIVGHSAGSIFHAPLIKRLTTEYNRKITTCTLWAPACTTRLFKEYYLPAITDNKISRLAMFTLKDEIEQDDNCAMIYHKSLLYLVSNALESKQRFPFQDGEPLLGMEKFIREDNKISDLFSSGRCEWVLTPNDKSNEPTCHSTARHHGDFDDDEATLKATIGRILGDGKYGGRFYFKRSASSLRERRLRLQ